jgi:3-dehydroquinate synthase
MFSELGKHSVAYYRKNTSALKVLIKTNALHKTKLVKRDEFETGERKLLNFGHTLGHAIENLYELSHGEAVSIGMTYASHLSELLTGFSETDSVVAVLKKYGLPTYAGFDLNKAFAVLQKDKKKEDRDIQYILLKKIGKGLIQRISLKDLQIHLQKLVS